MKAESLSWKGANMVYNVVSFVFLTGVLSWSTLITCSFIMYIICINYTLRLAIWKCGSNFTVGDGT